MHASVFHELSHDVHGMPCNTQHKRQTPTSSVDARGDGKVRRQAALDAEFTSEAQICRSDTGKSPTANAAHMLLKV